MRLAIPALILITAASTAWAQPGVEAQDPTALAQYQADGTTVLAQNGVATSTTVVLAAIAHGTAAQIKIQVEVKETSAAFTNVFTHQAAAWTTEGNVSTVTVTGLTPGLSYKWQARGWAS